jgi:hypothetical protein
MIKKAVTLFLFLIACKCCCCQILSTDSFNRERVQIVKHSMVVLGSWGAANLIYNGLSLKASSGSNKYFHRMNLIFGGVNVALAGASLFFSKYASGLSYSQTLKKQTSVEKIFLFNAGLDVAYVVGGFYFKERKSGNVQIQDRNEGYGKGIILQGCALFLFDGIMYLIHQKHGKQLYKLADRLKPGIIFN